MYQAQEQKNLETIATNEAARAEEEQKSSLSKIGKEKEKRTREALAPYYGPEWEGKKKKEKTAKEKQDNATSKAALVGSSDAVSTLLRGAFGVSDSKKQLKLQEQQVTESKKTNDLLSKGNKKPQIVKA